MKTIFFLALAVLGMAMTSCSNHTRAKYNDIIITVERTVNSQAIKGDTILAYPSSQSETWLECSTCTIETDDIRKVILLGGE